MNILGISCFYHDAAACLIQDGRLVAAASEERFTRKKHDEGFPHQAIQYCLKAGKITTKDLDYVGFYDKPFLKFERLLSTYLSSFPRGFRSFSKAMPVWLKEKLWVPQLIRKELKYEGKVLFTEHHVSHAASAFLVIPFTEEGMLKRVSYLHRETKMEYLCMAGGVALNCVANGRILRDGPCKDLFIQPAAGDAGGSLGVAAYIYHSLLGNPRTVAMENAF